jgi:hypothetical protein
VDRNSEFGRKMGNEAIECWFLRMRGNGGVVELTSRTAILVLFAMVTDGYIIAGEKELIDKLKFELKLQLILGKVVGLCYLFACMNELLQNRCTAEGFFIAKLLQSAIPSSQDSSEPRKVTPRSESGKKLSSIHSRIYFGALNLLSSDKMAEVAAGFAM